MKKRTKIGHFIACEVNFVQSHISFLLKIGMLTAINAMHIAAVTITAALQSPALSAPVSKPALFISEAGLNLLTLGKSEIRYAANAHAPVPRSTPAELFARTEKSTVSAIIHTPKSHWFITAGIRFLAIELSQKYAL